MLKSIQYESSENRRAHIFRSSKQSHSLTGDSWQPVTQEVAATDAISAWTDPESNTVRERYYRIEWCQ
ncbi:MAG: hypothetical protein O2960_05330 [Verrucomicrobia bacterium]|nr:hypothetical protein [Verrucomicrobiota bacterium]